MRLASPPEAAGGRSEAIDRLTDTAQGRSRSHHARHCFVLGDLAVSSPFGAARSNSLLPISNGLTDMRRQETHGSEPHRSAPWSPCLVT